MGLSALPNETVARYVGNGAPVLIQRALPDASEEDWSRGLKYFLDYYREHMLDNTITYPGVREGLAALQGMPMAILTNKPVRFVINTHYHLDHVNGNDVFAHQDRQREIAEHPFFPGHIGLEAVAVAEKQFGALALDDQRIEG